MCRQSCSHKGVSLAVTCESDRPLRTKHFRSASKDKIGLESKGPVHLLLLSQYFWPNVVGRLEPPTNLAEDPATHNCPRPRQAVDDNGTSTAVRPGVLQTRPFMKLEWGW